MKEGWGCYPCSSPIYTNDANWFTLKAKGVQWRQAESCWVFGQAGLLLQQTCSASHQLWCEHLCYSLQRASRLSHLLFKITSDWKTHREVAANIMNKLPRPIPPCGRFASASHFSPFVSLRGRGLCEPFALLQRDPSDGSLHPPPHSSETRPRSAEPPQPCCTRGVVQKLHPAVRHRREMQNLEVISRIWNQLCLLQY